VAYPAYVREKARSLRVEKHLSLDEIAARLSLPKTTVYYWVRDLPLGRPRRWNAGQRKGSRNMQRKYALRRAAAYPQGRIEFAELTEDPTFRDFLCLYMAEGSNYSIQYHADQDLEELRRFWAARLAVTPEDIRLQRKSNSGRLAGRTWRSRYGVLTVSA
jgi:AcrR family transcriptional regulator